MIKKFIIAAAAAASLGAIAFTAPAASAATTTPVAAKPLPVIERLSTITTSATCGAVIGGDSGGPGPCKMTINASTVPYITLEITGPRLSPGYYIDVLGNGRALTRGYLAEGRVIKVTVPRGTRTLQVVTNRQRVTYRTTMRITYESVFTEPVHRVATVVCLPKTPSGTCYTPGEFCSTVQHEVTGKDAQGVAIKCVDNDGWRWEAV